MSSRASAPTDEDLIDAVVVGAGPAGTATALHLVRAGRRVTVIDRAVFPRDKCCGDGLTTLALRELDDLGLDPSSVPNWQDVDAAWLRSPSGREVCVPLPAGRGRFAATTPRLELDAALVDLARARGVRVLDGTPLESIEHRSDRVTVHTGGGTFTARYLVAADGMWSPCRKLLGLADDGYRGEWHAFRQYVRNVTGSARERLYVWFEPDLLPGYMWSFPLPGGRANIGFGIQRDGTRRIQDMKGLWADLLQRPHVLEALGPGHELEDRHTAWPIPAAIDRAVLAHGRTLFVGDAARATDVLTGEGIGQALLTGRLAAESIAAVGASAREPLADPHGDAVRARYETEVRHHLLADHRMSARLSNILAHRRGADGALRLVDTFDWTRRNFARWMFEDEPRALLLTPSRWHRRILRRDGAYAGRPG